MRTRQPPSHAPTERAREHALIVAANDALTAGRAGVALALVGQGDAMFPTGMLREERASVRVRALCALGRTDEARDAMAAFARDAPRSPYMAVLRASCAAR